MCGVVFTACVVYIFPFFNVVITTGKMMMVVATRKRHYQFWVAIFAACIALSFSSFCSQRLKLRTLFITQSIIIIRVVQFVF